MKNFGKFMKTERLYILLMIFVILMSVLAVMPGKYKAKSHAPAVKVQTKASETDIAAKKAAMEKLLTENRPLAVTLSAVSMLIILIILLGIMLDITLLPSIILNRGPDINTYRPRIVGWGAWDVVKVATLFLFFGYMIVLIEAALARGLPLLKNDNFRMVLNSSVLDCLIVVFILYFTVGQYKEKLITLGITSKQLFKNIFYGVAGYIATIPVLLLVLITTAIFINLIKYTPEKQAVVELFMKERNPAFLLYTSIFAAIGGPVIEELFFRGFMYNAFKKYAGIFPSMIATAILFAGLHAHPVGFLPILVLGIALTYLYEKTGSLVGPIALHAAHNLSMVLLIFLAKQLQV